LKEISLLYTSALKLLKRSKTRDRFLIQSLVDSFAAIVNGFNTLSQTAPAVPETWKGFSLKKELRRHEGVIADKALRDAGGSVTAAAKLLGFRHHQSLISIINTRHDELLSVRSVVRKRRRPLLSKTKAASAG
jgi:hypothetical protein